MQSVNRKGEGGAGWGGGVYEPRLLLLNDMFSPHLPADLMSQQDSHSQGDMLSRPTAVSNPLH